jgi:hypothetical protein
MNCVPKFLAMVILLTLFLPLALGDGPYEGEEPSCPFICEDASSRGCYTGPKGTAGIGECASGIQICENGAWGECMDTTPEPEQSMKGLSEIEYREIRDPLVNVEMDKFAKLAFTETRRYLATWGIDGRMAVLIPLPEEKAAIIAHFHYNGQKADNLIKDIIKQVPDDVDKKFLLIGGFTSKTDSVTAQSKALKDKLEKGLTSNGFEFMGISEHMGGRRVRNVIYDTKTASIYLPYDEKAYKIEFEGCDGKDNDCDGETDEGCTEELDYDKIPISLFLDREQTRKERGIKRSKEPFTPFDDIICEFRVPKSQALDSYAATLDVPEVGGYTEITRGKMENPRIDGDYKIFQWKIDGWPNGWTQDQEVMEKILRTPIVTCRVVLEDNIADGGIKRRLFIKKGISQCVHIGGEDDAEFGVVTMRTTSSGLTPKKVVEYGSKTMSNGYLATDPFKSYSDKFSFWIDLLPHDDSGWEVKSIKGDGQTPQYFATSVRDNIPKISACGKKRLHNLYTTRGINTKIHGGYATLGGRYAIINPIKNIHLLIALHESGHAIGWLQDEYLTDNTGSMASIANAERNCETDLPLDFLPYGKPYRGCTSPNAIRTTEDSIMRDHRSSQKFNVWSCAFLVTYFKQERENKEKLKQYAKECNNMDVVSETCKPENTIYTEGLPTGCCPEKTKIIDWGLGDYAKDTTKQSSICCESLEDAILSNGKPTGCCSSPGVPYPLKDKGTIQVGGDVKYLNTICCPFGSPPKYGSDGVLRCTPTEACDGIDNNNNKLVDEGCDSDQDGYIDNAFTCTSAAKCHDDFGKQAAHLKGKACKGCVSGRGTDCDDEYHDDPLDNFVVDEEGRVFGACPRGTYDTTLAKGYLSRCAAVINSGEIELCDGVDNDCDGLVDAVKNKDNSERTICNSDPYLYGYNVVLFGNIAKGINLNKEVAGNTLKIGQMKHSYISISDSETKPQNLDVFFDKQELDTSKPYFPQGIKEADLPITKNVEVTVRDDGTCSLMDSQPGTYTPYILLDYECEVREKTQTISILLCKDTVFDFPETEIDFSFASNDIMSITRRVLNAIELKKVQSSLNEGTALELDIKKILGARSANFPGHIGPRHYNMNVKLKVDKGGTLDGRTANNMDICPKPQLSGTISVDLNRNGAPLDFVKDMYKENAELRTFIDSELKALSLNFNELFEDLAPPTPSSGSYEDTTNLKLTGKFEVTFDEKSKKTVLILKNAKWEYQLNIGAHLWPRWRARTYNVPELKIPIPLSHLDSLLATGSSWFKGEDTESKLLRTALGLGFSEDGKSLFIKKRTAGGLLPSLLGRYLPGSVTMSEDFIKTFDKLEAVFACCRAVQFNREAEKRAEENTV